MSRTQRTLYNLNRMFYEEVTTGQILGFQMFLTSPGPFPTFYDGALRADIGVLTRSNFPGQHKAKQNISSACKDRLVHKNIYMTSASGGATLQVIWSDKLIQVMDSVPTDSEWFTRFMTDL